MATTEPDLSEFLKLSGRKKAPCKIAPVVATLTKAEREQFEAAVGTDAGIITTGAIQQWLVARGHDVSVQNVIHHRSGRCPCARA